MARYRITGIELMSGEPRGAIPDFYRDIMTYIDAGGTDFSHYVGVLEERQRAGRPAPESLAMFMYRRDPSRALGVARPVYGKELSREQGRAILWAEHVVNEVIWRRANDFEVDAAAQQAATEQLTKLLDLNEWWIDLYVAAVLDRHARLATPALLQRLKASKHPIIRRFLQA